jgi:zinc transport system substrate-binding protein
MRRLPQRPGGLGAEQVQHSHDAADPHLWLSPANAARTVQLLAGKLGQLDPVNAARYLDNAHAMQQRISALDAALRARLSKRGQRPFLVYHDASQYFEQAYELHASGSVTPGDDSQPGARRLAALRERVASGAIQCIFYQPPVRPPLVDMLAAGREVRIIPLDPLGRGQAPGPDAWFDLMAAMGDAYASCFEEPARAE